MIEQAEEAVRQALGLGLDAKDLGVGHMVLRGVVVFAAALAMVRLANKRFFGESTAFDLVLVFVLGSVLSRAITGNAPFFPTLAAGFVLVALHRVLAALAFRSHRLSTLIKGHDRELVRDGAIRWQEMRRSHITREDLLEAIRSRGRLSDPDQVESARLERSGSISVVPAKGEPRVLEIEVHEGVQRVRVELGATPHDDRLS